MAFSFRDFADFSKLAKGGMGEVYSATQISNKQKVAIKRMAKSLFSSNLQIEQFEEGARLAASLNHENIVKVYECTHDTNALYFLMEYVDGPDFEKLLTRKSFPWEIGIIIALQALKGLNFAHKHGIFHGDFKSNNILISNTGKVKITDFGLEYIRTKSSYESKEDGQFITPAYMTPELAERITEIELSHDSFLDTTPIAFKPKAVTDNIPQEIPDSSSDMWAAGVLLYRIFSGKFPFSGNTFSDLLKSIINSKEPIFYQSRNFLPEDSVTAINACLAKDPQRRSVSLDTLINSLEILILKIGIQDVESEIQKYLAGNNSRINRLEKEDSRSPADMENRQREFGDALKTTAYSKETENFNSDGINLNYFDFGMPMEQSAKIQSPILILNENDTITKKWPVLPSTRKGIRKVFAVCAIIVICIGVGIAFKVLLKNRPADTAGHSYSQKPKLDAKQISPSMAKTEIAVPETALPDRAVVIPPVLLPKRIFSDRTASSYAPDRKNAGHATNKNKTTLASDPRPAQAESGVLKINIKPLTATVFLDEKNVSLQEISVGKIVTAGPHFIAASAPGYESYQNTFTLEAGAKQIMDISLMQTEKGTGLLHVYSYPWADLYIDGVMQGTTPTPKPLAFLEGEHDLKLLRQGYKTHSEPIKVLKGQVTRIQINLEKLDQSEK